MSPRPRRVVHVLGPSRGGIRRHVRYLATNPPSGWATEAIAGPEDLAPYFAGLPFVPTSTLGYLRPPAADLLHVHGLTPGIAALRPARPPVVLTLHMDLPVQGRTARWPILRALARPIVARADAVIAVSDRIAARFRRARSIPPAVDPLPPPSRSREAVRAELGASDDAVVALALARLHPDKRLDVFIDAVRRSGAVGWIAGEGPDRARLQEQAAGSTVRLLGYRDDPADLIEGADLVAMPSRGEGYPIAVVEAITRGCPVVAARVGAIAEIVGGAGVVVDPADGDAFAAALSELVREPDLLRRIRDRAAVRSLPTPQSLVGRVGAVYDELCP